MLLTSGCFFDSSGLAPSSPPAARDGLGDRGLVVVDGPAVKPDARVLPPPDSAPRGCAKGKIRCSKVCVDPATDPANCGSCGLACKATERCLQGLCCTKGWTKCGAHCVDVQADINNCGACGTTCKPTELCASGKCCAAGQSNCGQKCVDVQADINNCGACGTTCKAVELCASGKCCPKGFARCGNICANLAADLNHCGTCGQKCKAAETCASGTCVATGGCVPGSAEQTFGGGMVGCAGTVTYPKRATLCKQPGYKVCSATQWVGGHGAAAPDFNYWINEVLHYVGPKHACYVSPTHGNPCWPSMPMRVCAGNPDALGNTCNWLACGYLTPAPKHFFGGCNDNPTAGTLCCVN